MTSGKKGMVQSWATPPKVPLGKGGFRGLLSELCAKKRTRLAALVGRIERNRARLERELPDISPHDLELILWSLFRPKSGRRLYLRQIRKGMYVV